MYHTARKRLILTAVLRTPEDDIKDKKYELLKKFGMLNYKRSQMMQAIAKATGASLNVSELSLDQIDSVLAYLEQAHVRVEQLQLIAHPLPSQLRH